MTQRPGVTVAPVRVLVVCWGNSARSILGEALFRHLGGGRDRRPLRGHRAQAGVNPLTLRVLEEAGLPTDGLRSKSVNEYLGQRFDYVITVCDETRDVCPVFPGVHESLHWGYPDPAKVEGTEEERLAAFRSVFTQLGERIHQFLPDRRALRRGAAARRARVIALHLLRHAHAGDAMKWTGDDDVRPLSEKGIRQSERLGRLLAGFDEAPDLFITSPRLRASQTAEIVAKALDVPVIVDARLAEPLDVGRIGADPGRCGPGGAAVHRGPRPGLLGAAGRAARRAARSGCARARSPGSTSRTATSTPGGGMLRYLLPPELLPSK